MEGVSKLPNTDWGAQERLTGLASAECYAATQGQRDLERRVRKVKREVCVGQANGEDMAGKRAELGVLQRRLREHCEANHLRRDYSRERAYGVAEQPRALGTGQRCQSLTAFAASGAFKTAAKAAGVSQKAALEALREHAGGLGQPFESLTPARQLAALKRALRGLAGRAATRRRTAFHGVRAQLGDELTDLLERRLAECPDRRVVDMYRAAAGRLVVRETGLSGSALYDPRDDGVHLNVAKAREGDSHQLPGQVVFHEFGHMVDSLAARAKGALDAGCYASVGFRGGAISKAMKADWYELKKRTERGFVEQELRGVLGMQNGNVGLRVTIRNDYGLGELSRRLRRGEVSADDAIAEVLEEIEAGRVALPKRCAVNDDKMVGLLVHGKDPYDAGEMATRADASDAIEAVTGIEAPFGVGHKKDAPKYWQMRASDGVGHHGTFDCVEFFAEFCDATMANEKATEFTRSIFPTAWGLCAELAEEIARTL